MWRISLHLISEPTSAEDEECSVVVVHFGVSYIIYLSMQCYSES